MSDREVVSFYYSVGSRYSYLASTQVEALEEQTGCQVLWRPLHSVDLYRLRGPNPFEGEAVSGQYDWDYRRYDAECWADYYGVTYKEPRGSVEFDPRMTARACVAADRLGAVRTYSRSMFDAIFAEGLAKIGQSQCVERAESVGLDGEGFLAELNSSETERRMEETDAEARAAGAFGVPTFVVGEKMFFGNDRLPLVYHFVEQRLRA